MSEATLKAVRFSYDVYRGYVCDEPGEQDGEYVKAEIARDLLAACEMQAMSQTRVNGKWTEELESLIKSCGWDGEEVGELFIRRFRDAAIQKASGR